MAKTIGIFMEEALIEGVGNAIFISCRTDELRDFPDFCSLPFSGCSVKFSQPSVDVQWTPVLLQCTFSVRSVTSKKSGREGPLPFRVPRYSVNTAATRRPAW
ncbi:MAG: hypothetical protein JXA20_00360 [Spirochaetes bacterium]|nr:hypothetical protein [Spirochaetota bacterium]